FDLGLVHDAFAGNFFSSALSTENGKRFSLPSDSALIKNPEALLLTGPGLFPKLLDYRAEVLEDRNTNRQFVRQTVVLGELSQGLSYNMRVSRPADDRWNADRQFVFISPVCPNSL